jgi:hypothetical protein
MADLIEWKRLPNRVNFGCSHWQVPAERMLSASWLNLHGHKLVIIAVSHDDVFGETAVVAIFTE